jgi:plasmid replication initiation protein
MSEEIQTVRKANQLIEAKYKLSLHESKILAYLVSQIQPTDHDFREHVMTPKLLSKECNIPKSKVYPIVKEIAKKLTSRVIEIYSDNGDWTAVSLMYRSRWIASKKQFQFVLHPDLRPLLLDLRSNYTQYSLLYALRFTSSYSIRIYELCLKRLREARKNSISFELSVDLFKEFLGIPDKYKQFSALRQRVIEAAIPEINKITDINVEITPAKKTGSRSFNNLIFSVEKSADNFPMPVKELIKFDVRADTALQLYEQYGGTLIREKIKQWFYYLTAKEMPDKSPMKNPAGFIIEKIKEGQQVTIDDQLRTMAEQRTLAEIEEEEQEIKSELTQKGTKKRPVKNDQDAISAKQKFGELAGKAEKAGK